MKIKKFKRVYNLIGFYSNENIISELLSIKDLDGLYNSFSDELNINLLTRNNAEEVIRYYLAELRELQFYFKGLDFNYSNEYQELAHTIYIVIFNEIQKACNTNKIGFFKLCDEVDISLTTFDNSISLFYEEKEVITTPFKTKADNFKLKLQENGFYNLDKVQSLSNTGKEKLIELLSSNSMAYGIAMLDFLGYCTFLDNENNVKYKTNIFLSRLYNENAKDDTQAKHYRNSLIKNRPRYTSYLHIEEVVKDYEALK